MKNLPDKIYLNLGEFSKEEFDETDFHDLSEVTWSEDDVQGMNEEYVRKGAFIEEAWDWIEDNMLSSNQQDNSNFYFKQFVNYMKGE